ncbi:S1 family peptidase [Streptomyces albipurpureus]|uniref:S1 family peptidase n=1 Tax=Streptomyces albipurpureus TaxID=2897419 RepID=A0ABT0UKL8_9ACTN|nr:S1 family peptidase [Streptomyces sp. CWNU-1]MCM2387806.1 S1 family peptidase [Streptomyces sp. CWNU-1]
MKLRSLVLPLLAAAGMLVPLAVPAAAQPSPTPSVRTATTQADSTVFAESLRLRGELGFGTSASELSAIVQQRSRAQAGLGTLVNEWGFIGTAAEAKEMRRRDALLASVAPTVRGLAQRDDFAGHFLDNRQGGRLVVQFAGALPAQQTRKQLLARAGVAGSAASDVEFRVVKHSTARLTRAMKALWGSVRTAAAVSPIVAIDEDVVANRLKVTISRGTSPHAVRATLAKLGVTARISEGEGIEEACTSRNVCDSPRRGGVGVSFAGVLCSIGWVVNRAGVRGAVTAGHCGWGTNTGTVSSGAGAYGSLTNINALSAGTSADMRYISIPSGGQPWLYESAAVKARVVTGSALGTIGATSCLYGRNSESARCGTISSTNASHTSSTCGCVVYGQSAASYTSAGGDSGGAVASSTTGSTARGVHSGTFGGAKHYSWIGYTSTYNMGSLAT